MDSKTMDLAAFDTRRGAEEGYELQLVDPKGEPLPAKIRLLGRDADAYEAKTREIAAARSKRLLRNTRREYTAEERDADAIELLATATLGWSGITLNGQDYAFTPENARKLYKQYPWIAEQVDTAVGDRANFLPRSARS